MFFLKKRNHIRGRLGALYEEFYHRRYFKKQRELDERWARQKTLDKIFESIEEKKGLFVSKKNIFEIYKELEKLENG